MNASASETEHLRARLAFAGENFYVLSTIFSRVGAVLASATPGNPNRQTLIELAQYLCEDYADKADVMREDAEGKDPA